MLSLSTFISISHSLLFSFSLIPSLSLSLPFLFHSLSPSLSLSHIIEITLRLAMDRLAIDSMDPSWLAFIISCNKNRIIDTVLQKYSLHKGKKNAPSLVNLNNINTYSLFKAIQNSSMILATIKIKVCYIEKNLIKTTTKNKKKTRPM